MAALVTAQKFLGAKPGTGGAVGVGRLQQVATHRFFAELCEIRDQL